MRKFLGRMASLIRLDGKRKGFKRQGGYVVISLAAIGLFGGIAAAAPVLNRAVSSLKANDASPAGASGARSAAEHAMWRLRNEPGLWSSMSGAPPSISYAYPVLGSSENAEIDIVALAAPPANPFEITIEVTPDVVPHNSETQVTYRITVKNYDVKPHQINRVTAFTADWGAPVVSGSTTGMTTANPTIPPFPSSLLCSTNLLGLATGPCYYEWVFGSPVTVPAFGGEAHVTWKAKVKQNQGQPYLMPAEVSILNEGVFTTKESASIRIGAASGIVVTESVTPFEKSAGVHTVYDYTLTVTNTSGSARTIDWLRHWSDSQLSYVVGSSRLNGSPISDPGGIGGGWLYQLITGIFTGLFNYDERSRLVWDLPPTVINPGQQVVLTFQMEGGLDPGIYTSRGEVLVDGFAGGLLEGIAGFLLQLPTSSSGETAKITISQGFTITAEHDGHTVIVSGYIMPNRIDIISWKEF